MSEKQYKKFRQDLRAVISVPKSELGNLPYNSSLYAVHKGREIIVLPGVGRKFYQVNKRNRLRAYEQMCGNAIKGCQGDV